MSRRNSMKVERITPAKAAKWLQSNTSNRPVSKKQVSILTRTIQNDFWKLNGDAIKFDKDGVLLDGQHRLHAIIAANKTVETYVMRGLDPEVYHTLGQEKSRTLGDMLGREGQDYYRDLGSAFRWVIALEQNTTLGSVCQIPVPELYEMYQEYPDLEYSVKFLKNKVVDSGGIGTTAACMALHYIFCKIDKSLADEFFTKVVLGVDLKQDMPELKLRNALIKDKTSLRKMRAEHIVILVIKSWNAKQTGKPLKVLKIQDGESRPKIVGYQPE